MLGSISECFSYTWMIQLASPVQDYCPEKNSESILGDEEIFVLVCQNARCITVDSHFQISPCLSQCMSRILKLFQCYNYLPVAYRAAQRAKERL